MADKNQKLATMSRAEKYKLLRALEEKKRRARYARASYVPNSGQEPVHACDKTERYVFSGNGSGKTAMLINEMDAAAKGYNPWTKQYTKVPAKIICVLDDPDKIALKMVPELRKWSVVEDGSLHKDGKPYYARITYPNGSFIKFITWGMEPMKAESIELDYLFCDEPPPYQLYNSLTRGMRELGSVKKTLIVGTPLAAPWLRRDVYEPWKKGELDYVECFRYDSDVNKDNVDWGRMEKWFARMSDDERAIRKTGAFFDLTGLALAHLFDYTKHVIAPFEWPRNWPCVVVVDFHAAKPKQTALVGINHEGRKFYIKEWSSKLPPREFSRQLLNWYKDYPVEDVVVDSLGAGVGTGGDGNLSFIEVMNEEGVPARSTSYAEKNDEQWIDRIQKCLELPEKEDTSPDFQIFEGNAHIISDIESVKWVKHKGLDIYKPRLDIEDKDALATLKYALAAEVSQGLRAPVHTLGKSSYQSSGVGWRDREIY